jgi:hypothetical protein
MSGRVELDNLGESRDDNPIGNVFTRRVYFLVIEVRLALNGLPNCRRFIYLQSDLPKTMGKAQKKRSMRRHNPVRVPDSHLPKGLASASSTSSKAEAILPIIQKVFMDLPDIIAFSYLSFFI